MNPVPEPSPELTSPTRVLSSVRVAVVMAGGTGERFWPLSRPERPKQLLRLTHPTMTMIEEAVERISVGIPSDHVYISTSLALQRPLVECGVVEEGHVLAEPAKRNTLGAICWVVASLIAEGRADATVAILTADHKIDDPDEFRATVTAGMDAAERQDAIVTIGITPTRPETGYGYIEVDRSRVVTLENGRTIHPVARFVEKPGPETAEEFLRSGAFLWNAGMFLFPISAFIRELEQAQPEAAADLNRIVAALREGNDRSAAQAFEALPNISVDYAVMERAKRVYVLPGNFPWDDVGAWDALGRSFPLDEEGNAVQGRTLLFDTSDCVVINDDPKAVVATLGVRDIVVVNTGEAVLVCSKGRAQEVRKIVAGLAK